MKKSLLALSLTALFFSCKKEKTEFTATDVTGNAVITGVCTKNVITPSTGTLGVWTTTARIPAAGVQVQVTVNKNSLYPNSIAQGADVYSTSTDANGKYSLSVKANATGVNALFTIVGFNGTQDTIINGTKKAGLYANYFGTQYNINAIRMGATYDQGVYNFIASNLSTNPNNILVGTAVVSGSVSINHVLTTKTGTALPTSVPGGTNIAVPAGLTVYLSLDKDPTTLAPKMYTTQTDANGRYSFTLNTVNSGTSGFNQNASIWVADYATTRDTVRIVDGNNAPTVTGRAGVFNSISTNQNGVYTNEIRNATNLNYNSFTAN